MYVKKKRLNINLPKMSSTHQITVYPAFSLPDSHITIEVITVHMRELS